MAAILLFAHHAESLPWRKISPSGRKKHPLSLIFENKELEAEVARQIGKTSIFEGLRALDEILGRVVMDIEEGKRNYEPLKEIVDKFEPEYQKLMKEHKQFMEDWKENVSQLSSKYERRVETGEGFIFEVRMRSPDNLRRRAVQPGSLAQRYEDLFYLINESKSSFLRNVDGLYDLKDYIHYVNNLTYTRQKAIDWIEIYKKKAEQSDIFVDPWIYFLGERFEYSTYKSDYQFNFNLSFLRHDHDDFEPEIRERRELRAHRLISVHDTSFHISHGRVSEISKDRRYMHFKDEESNNSATVKFYCGPNSFIRSVDEVNKTHVVAHFETPLICSDCYLAGFLNIKYEDLEQEYPWLFEAIKKR